MQLFDDTVLRARAYPSLRWMGGKRRLIEWLHDEIAPLAPRSALDAFCGTGAVAWVLRALGARVTANDYLRVGRAFAGATTANPGRVLGESGIARIVAGGADRRDFIRRTFAGIFFTDDDLDFLDRAWSAVREMAGPERDIALASLARAALKKQPRGVFTISGDLRDYDDGRRDLRLPIEEHFRESVRLFDSLAYDDGLAHRACFGSVFDIDERDFDLVYFDPPYVPRADDNCYIKRYHFIEGLMSYWEAPEVVIQTGSKVKKLEKRYSPFSYRSSAEAAFDRLFGLFPGARIVLSYSSNGWPDLARLIDILRAHRPKIDVRRRAHRYHFGTHAKVAPDRAQVEEYLIFGE